MDQSLLKPCTAFDGHRRLAVGALHEVAIAARRAMGKKAAGPLLIFDDGTGQAIEIDNRGSDDDVLARLSSTTPKSEPASDQPRETEEYDVINEYEYIPADHVQTKFNGDGSSCVQNLISKQVSELLLNIHEPSVTSPVGIKAVSNGLRHRCSTIASTVLKVLVVVGFMVISVVITIVVLNNGKLQG